MLNKNIFSILKDQKGLATIETVPLLVLFFFLMSYGLGLFGFVHSATLSSIAARSYAYETFRHRANVNYFRDDAGITVSIARKGYRLHAIRNYNLGSGTEFIPNTAPIAFAIGQPEPENNPETHNTRVFNLNEGVRNRNVSVSPGWIMMAQGICLSSQCGD